MTTEHPGTLTDEAPRPGAAEASRPTGVHAGPHVPIATEIPGRYQVGAELARGGQSVVYVAYDSHLGREVAFKTLLPGSEGTPAASLSTRAARFVREARVTAQLEHPGIAPVHEVGQRADGGFYVTQKLVRGKTLAALLTACATPAERFRLLPAYLGICQAVAHAHQCGVIHRDLKPTNLMVGALGEAVVIDWGLARTDGPELAAPGLAPVESLLDGSERTRDGSILGTPAYMSPEQAVGAAGQVDARSDVWSLGVILYEVLTGRRPFQHATAAETLHAVVTSEFPPVLEVCPEAAPELAAVAQLALQRDPRRRYPSAAELAGEVERWLAGDRVVAYEYSSWELARRFLDRNRASSLLALVVVIALAGSGLVTRSRYLEGRRQLAESFARLGDVAAEALRWDEAAAWYAAARVEDDSLRARLGLAHARMLAPRPLAVHHLEGLAVTELCDLPDGGLRALAVGETGAAVLDAETGLTLSRIARPGARSVRCAPDADRLVMLAYAGEATGEVSQWTLAGAAVGHPWQLEVPRERDLIQVSRDGQLLATRGDGASQDGEISRLVLHDVEDGRVRLAVEAAGAVSPFLGHHLTWSDSSHRLWHYEPDAGAPAPGREAAGLANFLRQLDGEQTLVGTMTGLVQRIPRDAAKPSYTGSSGQAFGTDAVALSPGARWLASGNQSGVTLWSWAEGRPTPAAILSAATFHTAAFTRDEARLVGALNHGTDASLSVWQVPDRSADALSTLTVGVNDLSPDGRRLAFRDRHLRIHVLDLEARVEVASLVAIQAYDRRQLLDFSATGKRLAVLQGGRAEVYELGAGREGSRLLAAHPAAAAPLALSPDGERLLLTSPAGPSGGALSLVAVGRPDPVWARRLEVTGSAFTADGQAIAVSGDGWLAMLDAASGRELRRWSIPAEGNLVRIALSADGHTAVAAGPTGVWRVDLSTDEVTRLAAECVGLSVAISADGAWIASSGVKVTLWHRGSTAPVLAFPEEGQADFVALSPDGRTLYHAGRHVQRLELALGPASVPPEVELDEVLRTYQLAFDGQRVVPATR